MIPTGRETTVGVGFSGNFQNYDCYWLITKYYLSYDSSIQNYRFSDLNPLILRDFLQLTTAPYFTGWLMTSEFES